MVGCSNLRDSFIFILSLVMLSGCGSVMTKHKFYEPITKDLRGHEYEAAVQKIEAAKQDNRYEKKDRMLYYLDAGFANHYALHYDTSIVKLSLAESSAEDLFTKSVSRAAASLALNDNILEYSGEDYEILYTNLFNALNYLAKNEFDDAFVEIRRANEKLDLLERKYAKAAEEFKSSAEDDTLDVNANLSYEIEKVRFNNDAFARYLSMHIYAADGKFDDAKIDYNSLTEAFHTQPHIYDFALPKVQYYADSGAVLSFVALAGMAPVKESLGLRIRTDKDLDLVQVLYTDGAKKDTEYGNIPFPVSQDYYFKFSLPQLMPQPSLITGVKVWADDQYLGELSLIEDVSKVAEETFKAKRSLIYFRTIARAIVKGLAAHEAKQEIDDKSNNALAGWLMKAAVDVGTDIIENADLRCTHLLPGKIYVGDFEIQPGTYDFTIEFIGANGETINRRTIPNYQVYKSGWNMIEAFSLN